VPGANFGEEHAVFEAVHGSARHRRKESRTHGPDAVRVLMLEHLGTGGGQRLQAASNGLHGRQESDAT